MSNDQILSKPLKSTHAAYSNTIGSSRNKQNEAHYKKKKNLTTELEKCRLSGRQSPRAPRLSLIGPSQKVKPPNMAMPSEIQNYQMRNSNTGSIIREIPRRVPQINERSRNAAPESSPSTDALTRLALMEIRKAANQLRREWRR